MVIKWVPSSKGTWLGRENASERKRHSRLSRIVHALMCWRWLRFCHRPRHYLFGWGTKQGLCQMNLYVYVLTVLPHTVTWLVAVTCALPWCMRHTLPQYTGPSWLDCILLDDLLTSRGLGMFWTYVHLQHQNHKRNKHSSSRTVSWCWNTSALCSLVLFVVRTAQFHLHVRLRWGLGGRPL
jgi:hypothetical protein